MITRKNKIQNNPQRIGLLGTRSGVGVTHTGILLAEFLKEKLGAKVAFVEKNYHGDVERLGEVLFGCTEGRFTYHGIDYYPMEKEDTLKDSKRQYDYLILDFGTQKKKNIRELEQCEKKVMVGTLNLWEWQEYLQTAGYYKENMKDETMAYVISFGNERLAAKAEKKLKSRICFLGAQPIGKELHKEVEHFFYTLISYNPKYL